MGTVMTDKKNQSFTADQLKEAYQASSQFDPFMGLDFEVVNPGEIVYRMEIAKNHLSSPDVAHGGSVAAMMDATLGMSALSYAVTQGKLCATVEFKINYLGPAMLGDKLVGKGKLDFTGNRLVVTSGEIINAESSKLVAKGMGTFNLYPIDKQSHFLKKVKKPS